MRDGTRDAGKAGAERRVLLVRAAAGGVGGVLTLALAVGGFSVFSSGDRAAAVHASTAEVPAMRAFIARPDSSGAGESQQIAPLRPLSAVHSADVLVRVPSGATAAQAAAIFAMKGVDAVEPADYARASVAGHQATLLGVNPSTFRMFTPSPTAKSDALWSNVSAGDLAVSFEMGQETRMPLGKPVDVRSSFPARLRVGAFATMVPGVDAVVSDNTARAMGIPHSNALLISANKANAVQLDKALRKSLPKGAGIQFLRSTQPVTTTRPGGTTPAPTPNAPTDANGFLSTDRIATAIKAAYTKLGRPYVWGAEGPNTFDCSGLVQWAFAKAGVAMPRVTDQQFLTGKHVSYSHARPGDLLFWRNDPTAPNYVSHVAIYLGQGKMIAAPHTGDVVKIENVYLQNFAGAVRIQVRR